LDGEDFILQVHRVFTRIRLRALLVVGNDGARVFADYGATAVARVAGRLARATSTVAIVGNGKP
jgi:hypothetical protein